jgi:serine/threonine-protein kinase
LGFFCFFWDKRLRFSALRAEDHSGEQAMSVDFGRMQELFLAAVEQHAPSQWDAYLDQACGGDEELRSQVARLLDAHRQGGSLPGRAVLGLDRTGAYQSLSESPGTVIGPYKLMEQIGEGGMGLVFVAEQQHPVRRQVALKVLKPGMDSRQVIARFEAERQALALMDHPHIAQVFDGGTTPAGRPYFVMELVKGVPITDFCDHHHLPIRARLELFGDVCSAVQHAHQKGIIHRDLKPSNVLVVSHDGEPVAKVIDFGIAKALGQHLTDKTIYTQLAQLVGTPLYMSPEQAGQSGLDIDTRSDIYALGVLLYELLTGRTPFDPERLRQAGYDEMRRIIREEEPPRPSTRISTLGQAAATVSSQRQSEPKRLSQLFRGELDWIVMKALEKDRNRRYETASAFAADVQRYLQDEPVQACPPSAWYRLRKFARRQKAALAMAACALVALAGIAGSVGWAARDRAAAAQQIAHDRAVRRAALEGKIGEALAETQAAYERDRLPDALAAIRRAEELCGGDNEVGDDVRQNVNQWRAELTVLQRLEDLSCDPDGIDWRRMDAAYADVFRQIGIDVDSLPAEEAGRRIRAHRTWQRLAEGLDVWARVRHQVAVLDRSATPVTPAKQRVFQAARAADPDDLRTRARLAAELWDLDAAERLAGLAEVTQLPRRATESGNGHLLWPGRGRAGA